MAESDEIGCLFVGTMSNSWEDFKSENWHILRTQYNEGDAVMGLQKNM